MDYMELAIQEAKRAAVLGEIPVGAVIVRGMEVIATGHNLRETKRNALCHAEISAIHEACRKVGDWRLSGCDIYVTLEPCLMCTGAIINARLRRVYFGAYDPQLGCLAKGRDLFQEYGLQSPIEVYGGIREEDCKNLLQEFFQQTRKEFSK